MDVRLPAAVAPGVALCFAERPEPSHEWTVRRAPDGSSTQRTGRRGVVSEGVPLRDRTRSLGACDRRRSVRQLELEPAWTPEHLLLAGLTRCTLQSLRFHADRMGADFVGTASAVGPRHEARKRRSLRLRRDRRRARPRSRARSAGRRAHGIDRECGAGLLRRRVPRPATALPVAGQRTTSELVAVARHRRGRNTSRSSERYVSLRTCPRRTQVRS